MSSTSTSLSSFTLPAGWKECIAKSGKPYYHHHELKKSVWTLADVERLTTESGASATSSVIAGDPSSSPSTCLASGLSSVALSSLEPSAPQSDCPLPDGWKSCVGKQGKTFYYHAATKKSQWTFPSVGVSSPLRAGWKELKTKDGKTFYHHSETGKSVWMIPSDDSSSSSSSSSSAIPRLSIPSSSAVSAAITSPSRSTSSGAAAGEEVLSPRREKALKLGSKVCPRCSEKVYYSDELAFAESFWHKKCFTCKKCNKKLVTSMSKLFEGDAYCSSCFTKLGGTINRPASSSIPAFERMRSGTTHSVTIPDVLSDSCDSPCPSVQPSSSTTSFSSSSSNNPNDYFCSGCSKPFVTGEAYVSVDSSKFHEVCLKCAKCSESIRGQFMKVAGTPYCQKCGKGGFISLMLARSKERNKQ